MGVQMSLNPLDSRLRGNDVNMQSFDFLRGHQLSLDIFIDGIGTDKCIKANRIPFDRFCAANVYGMETDENTGQPGLKIYFTTCLHCGTR